MCSFDSGLLDYKHVEAVEPYRITVLGDHAFIYGPNDQSVNMPLATMTALYKSGMRQHKKEKASTTDELERQWLQLCGEPNPKAEPAVLYDTPWLLDPNWRDRWIAEMPS